MFRRVSVPNFAIDNGPDVRVLKTTLDIWVCKNQEKKISWEDPVQHGNFEIHFFYIDIPLHNHILKSLFFRSYVKQDPVKVRKIRILTPQAPLSLPKFMLN